MNKPKVKERNKGLKKSRANPFLGVDSIRPAFKRSKLMASVTKGRPAVMVVFLVLLLLLV